MSLTIEAGKFYKTRSGLKARIYATDCRKCGYSDPVAHGAIFDFAEWNFREWWLSDGKDATVEHEREFDLVTPWADPPVVDWRRIVPGVLAVVFSPEYIPMGYMRTDLVPLDGRWSFIGKEMVPGLAFPLPRHLVAFSGDWRDSLAIRPGCESYTHPFPPYNSSEPTPGPWRVGNGSCVVADGLTGHDDPRTVESYGGHLVCESATRGNLHLIAAAPQLFGACNVALDTLGEGQNEAEREAVERLRQALYTALGIPF